MALVPEDERADRQGRQRAADQQPGRREVFPDGRAQPVTGGEVERCPDQRREQIDQEETLRRHREYACHQRDHGAYRAHETPDRDAPGAVAQEVPFGIGDPLRVRTEWPGALDIGVEDPAQQVARTIACHRARPGGGEATEEREVGGSGGETRRGQYGHAGDCNPEQGKGLHEGDPADGGDHPARVEDQPLLDGCDADHGCCPELRFRGGIRGISATARGCGLAVWPI